MISQGTIFQVPDHLETHTRSQTSHFMSYSMDMSHMTWIWHGYYNTRYRLANVLSMSYPCHIPFSKKYIWIYLVYPKKKCIWYMPGISFHVICHTYPCPINVISLSGCPVQAHKWNSARNCIAVWVLHTMEQRSSSTTRFICQSHARGLLLCPRPLVGTLPALNPKP